MKNRTHRHRPNQLELLSSVSPSQPFNWIATGSDKRKKNSKLKHGRGRRVPIKGDCGRCRCHDHQKHLWERKENQIQIRKDIEK